jgi:hypothetical protein
LITPTDETPDNIPEIFKATTATQKQKQRQEHEQQQQMNRNNNKNNNNKNNNIATTLTMEDAAASTEDADADGATSYARCNIRGCRLRGADLYNVRPKVAASSST